MIISAYAAPHPPRIVPEVGKGQESGMPTLASYNEIARRIAKDDPETLSKRRKPMGKIIIIGSANMDMVIRTPRWPRPGETLTGDGFMLTPGGKGANQAVAAARLGGDARMIASVGADLFGDTLLAGMAASGVDTSRILRREGMSTGVALITVCAGENTILLDRAANGALSPADLDAHAEEIRACDALLLQLEVPLETTLHAREIARDSGCRVFVNPAPAPLSPLPAAFYRDLDFLIPNEHEAERITGLPVGGVGEALACLDVLREMGVRHPIITLGGAGAVYFDGRENRHHPAIPAQVVDTTAAGDTFVAGVAVTLAEGGTIQDAVDFATRAAHRTVQRQGAQPSIPTRAEVLGAGR